MAADALHIIHIFVVIFNQKFKESLLFSCCFNGNILFIVCFSRCWSNDDDDVVAAAVEHQQQSLLIFHLINLHMNRRIQMVFIVCNQNKAQFMDIVLSVCFGIMCTQRSAALS